MNNPLQLAIDLEGDAWVQSAATGISAFSPAGTPFSFSPVYDGTTLNGVSGISIDGLDQVWYYNGGLTLAGKISHAGSILSGTGYTGGLNTGPQSIAIDASNHAFLVNGSNMAELDNNGVLVASGNPGAFINLPANKMAIDAGGNKWFPQSGPENLVKTDTVLTSANAFAFTATDLLSVGAIAMDGGNNVWVANGGNGTVIGFKNDGSLITPPATGYLVNPFSTNQTGASPIGLGVDPSGNVWVAMQNRWDTGAGGQSDVQEFIGAAVPAVTPIALAVKNNKLGQRP
jgi:streptogramin lyase